MDVRREANAMVSGNSRVTIHMAASLDGFIARKDGSVDWLETSDEFAGGTITGVGFIPPVLNRAILDEVISVTDEQAFDCTRRLGREEGIIAGVSSGAPVHAALAVAARNDSAGKTIVVIFPETGERYITTSLFGE